MYHVPEMRFVGNSLKNPLFFNLTELTFQTTKERLCCHCSHAGMTMLCAVRTAFFTCALRQGSCLSAQSLLSAWHSWIKLQSRLPTASPQVDSHRPWFLMQWGIANKDDFLLFGLIQICSIHKWDWKKPNSREEERIPELDFSIFSGKNPNQTQNQKCYLKSR